MLCLSKCGFTLSLISASAMFLGGCLDPKYEAPQEGSPLALVTADPAQAPVITFNPPAIRVKSGELCTLVVRATGTEPLSYQWHRNNVPVPGGTGRDYIKVAVGADSGATWKCVVSNAAGSATSASAITHVTGYTLQAENAALSGALARSNHTGYSGTGFADFVRKNNGYVEWKVTLPNAATYRLEFRHANGSGSSRNLRITVNGATVNGALAFPATADWDTWSGVGLPANLTAGTHTIRATTIGTDGPNLDQLYVW